MGTLLSTQTLPACKEGDWTRARVQINNSSLQSLRKISVQQELNSWQQQLLLRKKNRQQLEQVLQLENTEALLKARQAYIRQQCQNIDELRCFQRNTQILFHTHFLLKISIQHVNATSNNRVWTTTTYNKVIITTNPETTFLYNSLPINTKLSYAKMHQYIRNNVIPVIPFPFLIKAWLIAVLLIVHSSVY